MDEAPMPGSAADPALSREPPLLEIRSLLKHFSITRGLLLRRAVGQVRAVDDVDLKLHRGETLGLVGESGCGKSTISELIMGLERPTAGQVLYQGQDVATMSRGELRRYRRSVQIIFQDPYASLNPRMTIGDIVAEGWNIHPDVVQGRLRRQRVSELLEQVGMDPGFANRYPHEFSGGQRQRVGIARALALQPDVIICDEPVSALDVSVQAQVINLLADLQATLGLAYLFIAHDLSVVRHLSHRIAVMYLGRIVETGRSDDVYEQPVHPYTQALLSAVPVHEPRLRGTKERIVLPGDAPSASDLPTGCRFRTRCWKAQDICSHEDPPFIDRGHGHPSACHFAETRTIMPIEAAGR